MAVAIALVKNKMKPSQETAREALARLIDEAGSRAELARRISRGDDEISRWVRGEREITALSALHLAGVCSKDEERKFWTQYAVDRERADLFLIERAVTGFSGEISSEHATEHSQLEAILSSSSPEFADLIRQSLRTFWRLTRDLK